MSSPRNNAGAAAAAIASYFCAFGAQALGLDCAAIKPNAIANDQTLAVVELDRLLTGKELGGTACDSPLCNDVKQLEGLRARDELFKSAAVLFGKLNRSASTQVGDSEHVGQPLKAEFAEWYDATFGATREQIVAMPSAVWQLNGHVLFSGLSNEIDVDEVLSDACGANGSVGDCKDNAFRESSCAVAHAVLQRRVLLKLLEENRAAFARYLQQLNDQWDAYRSNGRSLYPWEIALNEAFVWNYQNIDKFTGPPTQQWVFLHPDVALMGKIESTDANDGLEETLIVELIGRDRWSWGDGKSKPALSSFIGISAIAAWSGSDDVSYGFMTHWRPNLAAGVTYGSVAGEDRFSLVLTVDLGKALTDRTAVRKSFDGLLFGRPEAN